MGIAQPQFDKGLEVRRIIGLQEFVDCDPVASDVACSIMSDSDVVQFPASRHDNRDRALIDDDPAASFAPGGCDLFLETAECFRRHADLMEPERSATERKVLDFIKGHVFHPAEFVIRSDGVCRLNPEMARYVTGIAGGR